MQHKAVITFTTEHATKVLQYVPNPRTRYLCVYCNESVRLTDENSVIDSYKNVVHLTCFDRKCAYLLEFIESNKPDDNA